MTKWTRVAERDKFGVAIFTYHEEKPHKLRLFFGDTLHILCENKDWYYGYCTNNRKVKGIFPKSYVHTKESILDKSGPYEFVFAKEPLIAHEISTVLREWGALAKLHYVRRDYEFETIRRMMYELVDWRKQILSGTLPVDELKEIKQKVAHLIDMGNWTLSLDMVVRDEQGNIMNPDWTGTINLYRQHVLASQRIQSARKGASLHKTVPTFTHSLYVTIKNCVCKITDPSQILMTIYDVKEGRYISENYVVKWFKDGSIDLEQLQNMKVLFTDLGSKDLEREKVFLVCQIVRMGAMEMKDNDNRRASTTQRKPIDSAKRVRRPFGAAVMDITAIISGSIESDDEYFVPFLQCGEKDFLDFVVRKLTTLKELTQREHKGQGLHVSLKLLHGDLKQVREENPHIISSTMATARKMGFPEVILPGDVRNDLYLTLVMGEFAKGSKTSDKNVEVTVSVCNEKGQCIQNVIGMGGGTPPGDDYSSVVYYHEDKPKWYETIKVAIPIEEFYGAHLLFRFKHRSSNEAKDRVEKSYALSFVRLMQPNGTTLQDEVHDLLVYKIDHKKFDETNTGYLSLPYDRKELETMRNSSGDSSLKFILQSPGLTLSHKDSFQISTVTCSTKLTQNVDLLGLLKWRDNPSNLDSSLQALTNVNGEEVVKFLQDTLDALFAILMENTDSNTYDNLVFDSLLFILGLISAEKYQHFRPILDTYIENNFSATLAYDKLITVLRSYIESANDGNARYTLFKTMRSLEYIFKFIVRSRELFSQLNEGKGKQQFEMSFKQLLQAINVMMLYTTENTMRVQETTLRYFPCAIDDILTVFNAKELASLLVVLFENISGDRLLRNKLHCMKDIVHGQLFQYPECRAILLPVIVQKHVKNLMENSQEMELCVEILSDILEVLHNQRVGTTCEDVSIITLSIFRTVIQTFIKNDKGDPLEAAIVSIMISIFRQMEACHYTQYIDNFTEKSDLFDFVIEILMVFSDLVAREVFPRDWNEMIMLQNSIILKAVRHISHTIRDKFFNPFEYQVWNNFFHGAIKFLTQKALQLENFSENKRKKIISRYKDMRRETGFEIRAMWFNLGQNKIRFVPGMVGPFLEMTLIPERELRKATIPIFFDMMQCEFYSPKYYIPGYDNHRSTTVYGSIRGNFNEFEHEMITQLDALIEGGRGDEEYKNLFHEIMFQHCESHATMKEQGLRFVNTVTKLMEYLLEYRSIVQEENKDNRMSCTVNLLGFYNEINRKEMYIRYLNKLCDLHLECQNYTEAAFALQLHTKLLKWSDDSLPQLLRSDKYPKCDSHRNLKIQLYDDIINYFDKGKMWEASLPLFKELIHLHDSETYDYSSLAELLKKQANFFDNIMKQIRPEPEYFRVAFYGRGFPGFVQNKVFVFRGKEYERLDEFSGRMQNIFPKALLMTKLGNPGEITETSNQYLQINKVDPIMEQKAEFANRAIHHQILKYYKVNEVHRFSFSRPFRKKENDAENEFANLWIERTTLVTANPFPGILRWFLVTSSSTVEITPLENAVETMELTNTRLREANVAHRMDPNLSVNHLGMLLNGVVDAAVMGGIANYEKAFFSDEFVAANNTEKDQLNLSKLKNLIAEQVPLLEVGIRIHKVKVHESLKPFHDRLEECFAKMKATVEAKYGIKSPEPEHLALPPTRRPHTMPVETSQNAKSLPDLNNVGIDTNVTPPGPKTSTSTRVQSVFVKPLNSNSPNRSLKKSRETLTNLTLRRTSTSSTNSAAQEPQSAHQTVWYDGTPDPSQPVIELKEQLISQRPRRSDCEKRLSRPMSGVFRGSTPPNTPGGGASTHSLNSLDEETPPPLPQKQSTADYGNATPSETANATSAITPPAATEAAAAAMMPVPSTLPRRTSNPLAKAKSKVGHYISLLNTGDPK